MRAACSRLWCSPNSRSVSQDLQLTGEGSRLPAGKALGPSGVSDSAASRLQSPGRGKEEKEEDAEGGEEKPEAHTRGFGTAPLTVQSR